MAIIVAVVILLPILAIASVTLLGRNASVKFSAVGSVIDPGYVYPSTSSVPKTPTTAATTTTLGRRILPGWTDVAGANGWRIAFPNEFAEDGAPVGPFGATAVVEAKSAKLVDGIPAERLEIFVLDTTGVSNAGFIAKVKDDMTRKLSYPALASKRVTIDGREALWFEPNMDGQTLLHSFTSVIALYANERSYVLVAANGSGTAGQDDLLQQFASSLDLL